MNLLQSTECRWLSRERVVTRPFELRVELLLVFKGNDKASFSDFLDNTKCLLELAYLADIYRHLNTLNTLFHDPKESILTSSNKTVALSKNTFSWLYFSRKWIALPASSFSWPWKFSEIGIPWDMINCFRGSFIEKRFGNTAIGRQLRYGTT